MKLLFSLFVFTGLVACGNHRKLDAYSDYVQVEWNADSTINELSAISDSKELNGKLNNRFQSISMNTELSSNIPLERIQEKCELFDKCLAFYDSCSYIPEGYSFTTNRNFLNLKYQHNGFGSYDLFYKHAVIDLESGNRLLYLNMFLEPNQVLAKFNAKYVQKTEDRLARLTSKDLSEDEQEEYEIIRDHLDTREPFQLHELNECELIFDTQKKKFTEIRFHYNGSGGMYKPILTEGYISFTLKELNELLLKEFKAQIRK